MHIKQGEEMDGWRIKITMLSTYPFIFFDEGFDLAPSALYDRCVETQFR